MSEIAQIKRQIEAECEALNVFNSFSSVASHQAITSCYGRIERGRTALVQHVGEEQALEVMCSIYTKVVK